MKNILLVLLQFFILNPAIAQINLVPNPDLEDTLFCPLYISQPQAANQWMNFGNSPEYLNACNSTGLGVPNSAFGYQYAHSGVGMLGLASYSNPTSSSGPNYREFVGTKLTSSLIIGQKYFLSFYVNFAATNITAIATNNLGMRLSTIPYDSLNVAPIDNFNHLNYSNIIADSIGWIKVSGSIVADSTYKYVMLGNFFDDSHTDTISPPIFPGFGYYYFDDICISLDSNYNENWTGFNNIPSNDKILIWPNPANNFVKLSAINIIDYLKFYSYAGQLLKIIVGYNCNYINISDLPDGIYFLTVKLVNSKEFNQQLIIIHN